jgi:hypothetical protein
MQDGASHGAKRQHDYSTRRLRASRCSGWPTCQRCTCTRPRLPGSGAVGLKPTYGANDATATDCHGANDHRLMPDTRKNTADRQGRVAWPGRCADGTHANGHQDGSGGNTAATRRRTTRADFLSPTCTTATLPGTYGRRADLGHCLCPRGTHCTFSGYVQRRRETSPRTSSQPWTHLRSCGWRMQRCDTHDQA